MNSTLEPASAEPRILQLDSLLTGGGTDDQCVKLAAGLHRLGQRVLLAGPGGSEFGGAIADAGVPFFDTGNGASQLQFILRIARLIRRENIQIVHAHHGRDYWPAIFAAKMSGARPKIVLTRHLAKSPASPASRHFLLAQCDALIAVSRFVARVLSEGVYEPESPEAERRHRPPLRGDHGKIHVIYGGIDTTRFRPRDAAETRRALGLAPEHFGFAVAGGYDLPRGKGQREFLAAAARVAEKIPRARFLIIGRGNLGDVLRADIARLGLDGKAWLTPYAGDMPAVMNAIDCLAHPQVGTEALGLVVCEAHACGKPVIASALDGIPEAFQAASFGRLVTPENIGELAEAMAAQAGAPPPDAAQAAAMHEKVARAFSMERSAAEVLGLYRGLTASPPGPLSNRHPNDQ
jgi:glycosyltransferase involved in cell wall biosynthesis